MDFLENALTRAQFHPGKMQKVNLFETDQSFMDLYCLLPGQKQKVHTHEDSDKYYFVLQGKGIFQLADERIELAAGGACLARPTIPHGVANESDQPLIVLVLMFPKPPKK